MGKATSELARDEFENKLKADILTFLTPNTDDNDEGNQSSENKSEEMPMKKTNKKKKRDREESVSKCAEVFPNSQESTKNEKTKQIADHSDIIVLDDAQLVQSKPKSKNVKKVQSKEPVQIDLEPSDDLEILEVCSRKKTKRTNKLPVEKSIEVVLEDSFDEIPTKRRKKNSKKAKENVDNDEGVIDEEIPVEIKKKNKKSKKRKEIMLKEMKTK